MTAKGYVCSLEVQNNGTRIPELEKHRKADQELKKRVLKLEFCLQDQEARSQTRKLARMGERRDKAIKELRDQLATKQLLVACECGEKQNYGRAPASRFWFSQSSNSICRHISLCWERSEWY